MEPGFRRIAIVNRGEAAMRLVRAVREWNAEATPTLRTIALYTEPDRRALFVREADEAFELGPPTFVDPTDGRRKNGYLDYARLEHALREAGAEAVWVGWGFVAEHAAFAELCRRLGVVFIGPSPEVMRRLGDKIGSKRLAEEAGVPVAPWSGGPVEDLAAARRAAERLGFPLMIKATAGGGGRGIRRVREPEQLAEAFESARSEGLKAFGDATVFMERLMEGARHVEVQIVGDAQGTVWPLGVRDCTVQRRNQKVLEESPSPALSPAQHEEIGAAAARLGSAAGYENAGTVEFLYDPPTARFSFMEVNARLQVEHPVTELTTGADLVKLQLHVALGRPLAGEPPAPRGHAIEARVNAEDPERGFAPAPGRIELFRPAGGPGVRVDTGFAEGDPIASEFDSMIAKVIVWGRDRPEALARLGRALQETALAVRGGASNKGFLLGLLRRPEVVRGEVDVGWLDRLSARGEHLPRGQADAAILQAAIDAYDAELAVEQAQFYATAARGRPKLRREVGHAIELRERGSRYELHVLRQGPNAYRIDVDGVRVHAGVERLGVFERRLVLGERRHRVLTHGEGLERVVEVDGFPHRLSRDDGGTIRAPAPAVVLSIAVREGDEVAAGDRLAVLEAMKTELPVLAPSAGKIRQILVTPNVQVETGAPLLVMEPVVQEGAEPAADRIRFASGAEEPAEDARRRCRRNLGELRQLMLGFDVASADARRLVHERRGICTELAPDDPELLASEEEILTLFADVGELFRRRESPDDVTASGGRSAEESLVAYLRSLDPVAADLSPAFLDRLQRALLHYGVETLERSPQLEEALLWMCKAHQRLDEQVGVVLSILERRLDRVERLAPHRSDAFQRLLDRIVAVTRGTHQGVSDLASEVRYRFFDAPFFEAVRGEVYARAEADLAALARDPDGAAREDRMQRLVACPQPLVSVLTGRFGTASALERRLMLEVLTRRYYRIRLLEEIRSSTRGERGVLRSRYQHDGERIHVVTTHASWDDLPDALEALCDAVADVPSDDSVVADVYAARAGEPQDADATVRELEARLSACALPAPVRRLVVALAQEGAGKGMGGMQHFTFRRGDQGLREDRPARGLHPMMAKRLQLWRLANFEVERLPSVPDVYLYHGTARDNPKDQRLFAFAEVRDLTPVRDEHGRVTRLPQLEMMFHEAVAGIRRFQSRQDPRRRLHWNRILLWVWPTLELGTEEINEVAHRLMPATSDLGLEKVLARVRMRDAAGAEPRERVLQLTAPGGGGLVLSFRELADQPIRPLSEYGQKVVRMRQRGMVYPYEIIRMLTPPRQGARSELPPGEFREYDLDERNELVPVDREPGRNRANVVVGLLRNFTARHPEGMTRVLILSDPSREMGSLAEPECRRIVGALDLAQGLHAPVDWFPVSAGAKIAMDSGTENLDWTARVLRRLIEFTQAGGRVNVLVNGVNVGAQSYWNAEATMLMHTKGILIMTPAASMVLTGKRALEYSGGVSAEDHQGIGGYERIMGPNGQAQYWAADLRDACRILLRHYEHTYVAPGERFPRRAATDDPPDRDVRSFPLDDEDGAPFEFVGEIFSDEKNPGRRKSFDVRGVMRAVMDQDHPPLERWPDMRHAEIAVVWDAHLGGHPVCLIGIESRPVPRLGFAPADGPDQWTAGTLFPLSSKKVARSINAASGVVPVVVLANLSGFDGSPESMRRLQLEFGAEIGRAVVNFQGPLVFCVISRYHGGAYVVFSRTLNENLQVAALEGTYASVIGGAPAAAVVFSPEVDRRTREDARLQSLEREIAAADEGLRGRLRARWHEVYEAVRSEKLGEVAAEFDRQHSVERALRVGSLDHIVPPARLRPYLIEAVERGVRETLERGA